VKAVPIKHVPGFASLNILRKTVPNVEFTNGIETVAVRPKTIKCFK
jgi:hypothetical protein